jgi:hypothetical protein
MIFSNFCIYTIRDSSLLRDAFQRDGRGNFTEQKRWVAGKRLLDQAKGRGEELAIVFAPAEGTKRLFAWGRLEKIQVQEDQTKYFFKDLTLLDSGPLKTTLKKRSDGKALSPGFIRPYAICHKPKFVVKGD